MDRVPDLTGLPSYVEKTTGYPMIISPVEDLHYVSTVTMAIGSQTCHIVSANRDYLELIDYIIAYQSGVILRFFNARTKDREIMGVTPKGLYYLDKVVKRHPLCKGLSPSEIENYRLNIFSGLLIHLRNTPIGLRIEMWIEKEYPQLADQQRSAIEKTLQDNEDILSPGVQRANPPETSVVVSSISAAYALFWAQKWNQPQIFSPYQNVGLGDIAIELLRDHRGIPDTPDTDNTLVDTWATRVGVRNWYTWTPHELPVIPD